MGSQHFNLTTQRRSWDELLCVVPTSSRFRASNIKEGGTHLVDTEAQRGQLIVPKENRSLGFKINRLESPTPLPTMTCQAEKYLEVETGGWQLQGQVHNVMAIQQHGFPFYHQSIYQKMANICTTFFKMLKKRNKTKTPLRFASIKKVGVGSQKNTWVWPAPCQEHKT